MPDQFWFMRMGIITKLRELILGFDRFLYFVSITTYINWRGTGTKQEKINDKRIEHFHNPHLECRHMLR